MALDTSGSLASLMSSGSGRLHLEMVGEAEVGGTVHGLLIGSFGSSLYSLVPLSGSGKMNVSVQIQYRHISNQHHLSPMTTSIS